jgi:isopenicillin N synthase-like dioxygenase
MREIPLIDITDPGVAIPAIETASRDVGFMYIVGHGIPGKTISAARAAVVDYFSLPDEIKAGDRITRDNYRGYIPLGFFSPASGAADADGYEGYKLHYEVAAGDAICADCDLYGPNRWPAQPPLFRERIERYWAECDRVAAVLLAAFARILGADPQRFLGLFTTPLTNMTLLHYPPQAAGSAGFGIHPHKDTDALTILAHDPVGGLMVKRRGDNTWIRADAPPGALTVNIGDMLELWSGGYFVSTPHKVVNASGLERYSFPYFVVPRFDTVVAPLKAPQPGFARLAVHAGDVSREVWRSNWPDTKSSRPQFDLGTLED